MAWGDGLRNLTNEIYKMHKEKVSYIRQLKSEIKRKRNDWKAERVQMKEGLLANFSAWDEARAKELDDLQTLARNIIAELREDDKERVKEVEDLKATVANMITEFKKEHEATAAAWRVLLANVGKVRKKKPGGRVKPPIEKKDERTAIRNNIEKKILAIIDDNPEGISLPEVAYILGVAFVTVTKDIKKLLKDGLIIKKDNKYFPGKIVYELL